MERAIYLKNYGNNTLNIFEWFLQLDFLMESTWKNHVKSPKLDLEKI